jgi:hypothetical protein
MVFSSDRQYTIRPRPGTRVTLDPASSTLTLPVVGRVASPTPVDKAVRTGSRSDRPTR